MSEEKKMMEEELEQVAGGNDGMGNAGGQKVLTVQDCNGTFLALRSEAKGTDDVIIGKLYPGNMVITYGETRVGSAVGGGTCTYIKVLYGNTWGWVHAGFVK